MSMNTINLQKTEGGPYVFIGKRGLTPVITSGDDGTIYVDGQVLTSALKDAIAAANAATEAAQTAADNIEQTLGDISTILDDINSEEA